jgi:hypothetical protein
VSLSMHVTHKSIVAREDARGWASPRALGGDKPWAAAQLEYRLSEPSCQVHRLLVAVVYYDYGR